MNSEQNLTVAVITPTLGRESLIKAIESVQQQTYPCKHYIFVDGEQFHQQAMEILNKFEHLVITYLPMNTGANGWTNSSINAIAPFLVKEDIVCFLDDDNWFEPNHIETGVKTLVENQAHYAYALRNFCDLKGEFVCVDSIEAIGEYARGYKNPLQYPFQVNNQEYMLDINLHTEHHIDTNCYFMTSDLARVMSCAWYSGIGNDRNVYVKLKEFRFYGVCTKTVSVNYVFNPENFIGGLDYLHNAPFLFTQEQKNQFVKDMMKYCSDKSIEGWGGKLIWEQEEAIF